MWNYGEHKWCIMDRSDGVILSKNNKMTGLICNALVFHSRANAISYLINLIKRIGNMSLLMLLHYCFQMK